MTSTTFPLSAMVEEVFWTSFGLLLEHCCGVAFSIATSASLVTWEGSILSSGASFGTTFWTTSSSYFSSATSAASSSASSLFSADSRRRCSLSTSSSLGNFLGLPLPLFLGMGISFRSSRLGSSTSLTSMASSGSGSPLALLSAWHSTHRQWYTFSWRLLTSRPMLFLFLLSSFLSLRLLSSSVSAVVASSSSAIISSMSSDSLFSRVSWHLGVQSCRQPFHLEFTLESSSRIACPPPPPPLSEENSGGGSKKSSSRQTRSELR